MGKNVPQQALMNLARAIAAEEQLSLNQRHLNEADIYAQVILCDKDDCFLLAGHADSCSPALLAAMNHNATLRDTLVAILGTIPPGPLHEAAQDILDSTTIY